MYALGLVLLEALTGKRAFVGTPQEVMMARLERSEEPTVIAHRTQILEPLVFTDTAGGDGTRRARGTLRWLVGLAALSLVGLALVLTLSTGDDDEPTADPRSESTATTSVPMTAAPPPPTTAGPPPPTTATPSPPTVANRPVVNCAQYEAAKRAVEAEKQRIQQQYQADKETRERLKKELEDQNQEIESQKQAARC